MAARAGPPESVPAGTLTRSNGTSSDRKVIGGRAAGSQSWCGLPALLGTEASFFTWFRPRRPARTVPRTCRGPRTSVAPLLSPPQRPLSPRRLGRRASGAARRTTAIDRRNRPHRPHVALTDEALGWRQGRGKRRRPRDHPTPRPVPLLSLRSRAHLLTRRALCSDLRGRGWSGRTRA